MLFIQQLILKYQKLIKKQFNLRQRILIVLLVLIMNFNTNTLFIPSLLTYVPVYLTNEPQPVVDAPNSAALFNYKNFPVIVDHASQNFKRLRFARPGIKAYLKRNGVIKIYVCTKIEKGTLVYGETNHLYDENNQLAKERETDLLIYTCADLGDEEKVGIWLTWWEEI